MTSSLPEHERPYLQSVEDEFGELYFDSSWGSTFERASVDDAPWSSREVWTELAPHGQGIRLAGPGTTWVPIDPPSEPAEIMHRVPFASPNLWFRLPGALPAGATRPLDSMLAKTSQYSIDWRVDTGCADRLDALHGFAQ